MVIFNAKNDTINVRKNAKIYNLISEKHIFIEFLFIFNSSSAKPPTMIGMLNKKLNSDDFFSSFPDKIKLEIVEPDLDNPGTTAKPWTTPTSTEFFIEISFTEIVSHFFWNKWLNKSKMLVIKNPNG